MALVSLRAPGRAPEMASAACTSTASTVFGSISPWCAAMALMTFALSLYFLAISAPIWMCVPLLLVVDRFAYIMQKPRTLGKVHIQADFGRHQPRKLRDFDGVLIDVLPVARPVAETPDQLDDLGMAARTRRPRTRLPRRFPLSECPALCGPFRPSLRYARDGCARLR